MSIQSSSVSSPRKYKKYVKLSIALHAALLLPALALAASDPGPRGGAPAAGGPLPGLTSNEAAAFDTAADVFAEVDGVPEGLGPRFNGDSCAGCHAFPAMGGSSPPTNPQIALAHDAGANNTVPSFLSLNGPVREARFVKNPDGTPDGGVHGLFTIAGRNDAVGCNITQPDFATALRNNNVIFRVPTPTFGGGLVEMIADDDIIANAQQSANSFLGIKGVPNRSGNDGSITRFGWKAQNKSLIIFAAEAYNVEQGVTNVLFPNMRDVDQPYFNGCNFNGDPESPVEFDQPAPANLGDSSLFAVFMQFLAPPTPSTTTPGGSNSIVQGRNQFVNVGCANCHTPSFTTQRSAVAALSQKQVNLYSDLVLHHMGPGLADRVSQGNAAGDQFRTAPLWGLGQRLFFLHDGRTSNLVTAIQAHKSASGGGFPASEANKVVDRYNALSDSDKQAVLNFLRSL